MRKKLLLPLVAVCLVWPGHNAQGWTPVPVKEDPLVRMPGTQPVPENAPDIETPTRCLNCHAGFNQAVEPGFNWQGSMMAHAARDFLYWSCLAVGAQDSIWATGRPNATDICLRCHMPKGWLEGRSDPTNGSTMTGADFDGVHCDFCHSMTDPFFENTYNGNREGNDWLDYWDETNASGTPSQPAADATYLDDMRLAQGIKLFNSAPFFNNNQPQSADYTENGSGQYFMDDSRDKRASFADANARHGMFYSRYHKSKYICSTCHDVSNPVLANLGADPTQPLPTENSAAFSYFHVERTFSEFMLSSYGEQGGAAGVGPFAPDQFVTSRPGNKITMCQDCHMRDGVGTACSQNGSVNRSAESSEHPQSGQPVHDLTGGNAWVSAVLASAVSGSPNYDPLNDQLLNQGPDILTLDMKAGAGVDPDALLAGVDRAKQQLLLAASLNNVNFDPASGDLSFRIQNQTGHKLISGFPEGRRMFINIRAYQAGTLIYEVNPYDYTAGTLKGLDYPYLPDPDIGIPASLGANEVHVDSLVYEMKPSSTDLTGEKKTFHFALATGRYKDNRIPPKGFRISEAANRLAQPVFQGAPAVDLYSAAEYAGGYDDVSLNIPGGADYVEINLYYQTTSREYIEFLRDEINGTGNLTLASPTPAGESQAYIAQTDPWFSQLAAWGNTLWQLWKHNMNLNTAAPFALAQATAGTPPAPTCDTPAAPLLSATGGRKSVDLAWNAGNPGPDGGYLIYYDQAGKLQLITGVDSATSSYTDRGLQRQSAYCYTVSAWNDCDGDGLYSAGVDTESAPSNTACATTR